jgi:hypothetical protein
MRVTKCWVVSDVRLIVTSSTPDSPKLNRRMVRAFPKERHPAICCGGLELLANLPLEILDRRFPMQKPLFIFLTAAVITLMPVYVSAQSGGGGGGGSSGGGSAGGASAGGAASGSSSGAGSAAGSPAAGAAGAGPAAVNGVPNGPASVGGLNNAGSDPSGAGNSSKSPIAPGTNSAGTANSSGSSAGTASSQGSTTVGLAGNPAGGASNGRVDGVLSPGPQTSGDAEIKDENAKVDRKVNSICKGC